MDLINTTDAVSHLFPVNLLEPEIRAAVIVKKTYTLDDGSRARPARDRMPLIPDRLDNGYGSFHGEIFFRKRGVDLCVLGSAYFERPVRRARVGIAHGRWRHELQITGDRVWEKAPSGALIPSGPEPFDAMPISYTRAFGGSAEVGGEDVPWPDNPVGRGYYETPEQAVGQLLANIEPINPPQPLTWASRVPVVGWGPYPMFWGLRAAAAVAVDPNTGELLKITPEIFNNAHPALILDRVDPTVPIEITGLRAIPIRVGVPAERPKVSVTIGHDESEHVGELDGVFVWTDAARLVLTWRVRFRYPVRVEQIRRAVLSFVE